MDDNASLPGKTDVKRLSREVLSRPVVATGRGGSGSRLLSLALQEHDVFLGNGLNKSGDSTEWVDLIYTLAIRKLTGKLSTGNHWLQELVACAENILAKGQWEQTQPWGWKLPETMLFVPEVADAFPGATPGASRHLCSHLKG